MKLYGIWSTGAEKWATTNIMPVGLRFTQHPGLAVVIYNEFRASHLEWVDSKDDAVLSKSVKEGWNYHAYEIRELGNDGRPIGEALNV